MLSICERVRVVRETACWASRTWSWACSTWAWRREDRILRDLLVLEQLLVDLQEPRDPLQVGLAEGQRELGGRDVDEAV